MVVHRWRSGLLLLCLLAGCNRDEPIAVYETTHLNRREERLIAAIFKQGESGIAIKMSGPNAVVQRHAQELRDFVESVAELQGVYPKTWIQEGATEFRMANFFIDDPDGPISCNIAQIPTKPGFLEMNIDRWASKLTLPPVQTPADLNAVAKRTELHGRDVHFVELVGYGEGKNPTKPSPSFPLKDTIPEGWQPKFNALKLSPQIVPSRMFSVTPETEVFISKLEGDGGGLTKNVVRWGGQIALSGQALLAAEKNVRTLKADLGAAQVVDLFNPLRKTGMNRLVGVLLPHQGSTWFLVLKGPADEVQEHLAEFETYVKTLKRG